MQKKKKEVNEICLINSTSSWYRQCTVNNSSAMWLTCLLAPVFPTCPPSGQFDLDSKAHPKEACGAVAFNHSWTPCQPLFVLYLAPSQLVSLINPLPRGWKRRPVVIWVNDLAEQKWRMESLEDRAHVMLEFARAESWQLRAIKVWGESSFPVVQRRKSQDSRWLKKVRECSEMHFWWWNSQVFSGHKRTLSDEPSFLKNTQGLWK